MSSKKELTTTEVQSLLSPARHVKELLAQGSPQDADAARVLLLQLSQLLLEGQRIPSAGRRWLGDALWSVSMEAKPATEALGIARKGRGRPIEATSITAALRADQKERDILQTVLHVEWLDPSDRPEEVVNDAIHEAADALDMSTTSVRRALKQQAPTLLRLRDFQDKLGEALGLDSYDAALQYLLNHYRRH